MSLVSLEKLKSIIQSDNSFAREYAVAVFERIGSKDGEVALHALREAQKIGFGMSSRLILPCRNLPIYQETFEFLISALSQEENEDARRWLSWVVADADVKILEANFNAVRKLKIEPESFEFAQQRVAMLRKSPEELWDMLIDLSDQYEGASVSFQLLISAKAIVDALVVYEYPREMELSLVLEAEVHSDSYLGIWVSLLCGQRQLLDSIPLIVSLLEQDGDYHLERAVEALGYINDTKVLHKIAENFHSKPDYFRLYASSVFSMIYSEESAELLGKLALEEPDDWIQIAMIRHLLEIPSKCSLDAALEMIREYDYDPEVASLRHEAVTLAEILEISFPEFEEWFEDRIRSEKEFQAKVQRFEQQKLELGLAEPYVRSTAKVGRNDPCPCGSGKKHKKCCLN